MFVRRLVYLLDFYCAAAAPTLFNTQILRIIMNIVY